MNCVLPLFLPPTPHPRFIFWNCINLQCMVSGDGAFGRNYGLIMRLGPHDRVNVLTRDIRELFTFLPHTCSISSSLPPLHFSLPLPFCLSPPSPNTHTPKKGHVHRQWKGGHLQAKMTALTRNRSTLMTDSPALEPWEINFHSLNHPAYGALLWQPKLRQNTKIQISS